LTVVDTRIAEAATDAALHRPDEGLGEISAVVIAGTCRGHLRLFALDPLGDRRRRVHRFRWHPVDPLGGPVARRHRNGRRLAATIGALYLHAQRALLVATDAEHHTAIAAHPQLAAGVLHAAAGGHLADHQRALRRTGREHHAAVDQAADAILRLRRRCGEQGRGQQQRPEQKYLAHQRS